MVRVSSVTSSTSTKHKWYHWYADFVFSYPWTVLLITLWTFLILPLTLLYLFPLRLDSNPEKGFNTRGTVYSTPRIGWSQLQPYLLKGSRVMVETRRTKRGWADDLLSSLGSIACYEQPIPAMDYLSQVIVSVPSFDWIFSQPFLSEMCSFHDKIRPSLQVFDAITPHRNIWHVANYLACLSPEPQINCTYIKSEDMIKVKSLVKFCAEYRSEIVDCRRECLERVRQNQIEQQPLLAVKCRECDPAMVPSNCSTQMMFDLFYRILPKDLTSRPFYINSFLPVYTYTSYQLQGFPVKLSDFVNLQNALKNISSEQYVIKGTLLDVKRDLLLNEAIADSQYTLLAGTLVIALVVLYTRSLTYCIACIIQLMASVLSSAIIYRIFSVEFPLMNLIVFVLLISIGSDGAFLLFSSFPDTVDTLNVDTFRECLHHTASTMFLTQFSTVVPFFLNIFSAVLAFRCFGLFSGFTLIINYVMLISFLPVVLILQRRLIDPIANKFIRPWKFIFYRIEDFTSDKSKYLLSTLLPSIVLKGRYLWLISLFNLTATCGYISITGLHLPQYNPLQLFVASDPNEFYDNNAERLFEFIEQKIALPLTIRLVFGISVQDKSSFFDSHEISLLSTDKDFELSTVDDIRGLAAFLLRLRTLYFIQHEHKFWPERFLDWSQRIPCEAGDICCNVNNQFYSDRYLDHCMRVSTSQLLTNYNDTPLYHNHTFEFVGYTALLPTKLKYSHRFANLSRAFDLLDHSINRKGMWYTPEWGLMSTWFDLQRSIIADSTQSVVISILVVLLFAASILRLRAICAMISIVCIVICSSGTLVMMGWEVGMLESVILVLAVSLSFDYTLHYGAALPSSRLCPDDRIRTAIERSTKPVSMAALSSALAGLALLSSNTHAFYQVAIFLLVSTGFSFLFATFFFLPLLSLFLIKNDGQQCEMCRIKQNAVQLRESYLKPVIR
ncbi:unnamed protein product [Bursaphelenchus okinawaensis]|uniref:SSD domain-containing protein n=1 Tax=Bursaphelenchus okinawaensis TaxID=465554 RepID=A0A811JSR6_9BILA|nr:unnamed protein product [Bursaphelenchus okinawaensis]CAG9080827.1 unnamed protein product [Bursaphelenchus okinawaensis]